MESRPKSGVGRGRTWAFKAVMILVVLGGLTASNLAAEKSYPAHSIYVGYNWATDRKKITFPAASAGKAWCLASDTASWMESKDNFTNMAPEDRLTSGNYEMDGRSLIVLVEK